MPAGQPQFPTLEEKVDADNRSIYVGQVIFYKKVYSQKAVLRMRFMSEIQALSTIHNSLHCRQPVATLSIKIRPKIHQSKMCQYFACQFSVGSLAERCTFGIFILGILSFKNITI